MITTNFPFQNCLFMSPESISILKESLINITKARLLILDAFISGQRSLDLHYFLRGQGYKFNRSTLFRTLRLFTDKKIIYRVSADGMDKYLLYQNRNAHLLMQEHSSFVCTSCGKAVQVDTIGVPKLKIPKGFTKQNMEIIIHGLCATCKS